MMINKVEIRTHFLESDEFILKDGTTIHMRAANQLVREKYGDS